MRLIIGLLIVLVFLVACQPTEQVQEVEIMPQEKEGATVKKSNVQKEANGETTSTTEEKPKEAPKPGSSCDRTCSLKLVQIKASYGETDNFVPGRGSYTGAGGLPWTVLPADGYCEGELEVPILIEEISNDVVLNEYTIKLKDGETSDRITHQTIKSVDFTLSVLGVEEECS